ncbi:MAG: hypothetical protein KDE22_12830, partial [Rhodobacterales bacterium]|nr:hypothetical protein [Rhodobacterales bacterium]
MALLRWLAGHLVLVFIVVVLVFVYVFRAEISTELGLKDVVDQETLARYWPTRQAAEPAPAPQVAATE